MSTTGSQSEVVLALAEEFLERYRQGERPALKEYADRLEMTRRRGEYWRLAFQGNLYHIGDEDYETISRDVDAALKKVAV